MKKSVLVLILFVLASCASSPILYKSLTDASYPKTTQVDVFKDEKPDREYTEIGRIEIKGEAAEESEMYAMVIAKAKTVGADAVILIKDEKKMELVQMPGQSIDHREATDAREKEFKLLVFLAVKYSE
ncbi:MAG: hypothetical protein JXB23_08055 [Candidatus Aminicenantes bacterium]|nr:hypothetical protein [Candidatus Aminicenantes bacterium]